MIKIEPQLEVAHIPEAVCLSFEHLDLVVEPFQGPGRDTVFEVRKEL